MTNAEKINIIDLLLNWSAQCQQSEAYPILLLAMPTKTTAFDVEIYRAGAYSNRQIKSYLQAIIDNLPDVMSNGQLIAHWSGAAGGFAFREVPHKGLCCLEKMLLGTVTLLVSLDENSCRERYYFDSGLDALEALSKWDGTGDPGGAWIKYKGQGEERSNPLKDPLI